MQPAATNRAAQLVMSGAITVEPGAGHSYGSPPGPSASRGADADAWATPAAAPDWAGTLGTPPASRAWPAGASAACEQPPAFNQPSHDGSSAGYTAGGYDAHGAAAGDWHDGQRAELAAGAATHDAAEWVPPKADRPPPPEEEVDELLSMLLD